MLSEHYHGTLEQGTEPTNAHIGPSGELRTHPGVGPVDPARDPERDQEELFLSELDANVYLCPPDSLVVFLFKASPYYPFFGIFFWR